MALDAHLKSLALAQATLKRIDESIKNGNSEETILMSREGTLKHIASATDKIQQLGSHRRSDFVVKSCKVAHMKPAMHQSLLKRSAK